MMLGLRYASKIVGKQKNTCVFPLKFCAQHNREICKRFHMQATALNALRECRIRSRTLSRKILNRRTFSSQPLSPCDKVTNLSLKGFATGALAGAFGSWVGLGGGFVSLPILTLVLRLTQHQAHGTSLCAVATTGFAGAIGYASSGHVDISAAALIAVAGMFTAGLGARVAHKLDSNTLQRLLGVFMILVAPIVPFKKNMLEWMHNQKIQSMPLNERPSFSVLDVKDSLNNKQDNWTLPHLRNDLKKTLTSMLEHAYNGVAFIGAGSGFLAGLFGVGGGAVTIPALTFTTDFNHHTALGTSLAAMVLPSIAGTFVHFRKGAVVTRVALPLAIGSLTGAFLGAKVGSHVPEEPLKYLFFFVMIILGGRTVIKAF